MTNPKWEIGPVKLANGCDAVIHRFCETRRKYIGEWAGRCGRFYATEWHEGGSNTLLDTGDPMLDLAPPPKKKVRVVGWLNVYEHGLHQFYRSEESALLGGEHARFACHKIDIEVEEGQGL